MKFREIAAGVPFCCPGCPAILVKPARSFANKYLHTDNIVLVLGSGDIDHISQHAGTSCLERDDYFLATVEIKP